MKQTQRNPSPEFSQCTRTKNRATVATALKHRSPLFLPSRILPRPSAQATPLALTATWLETSSHSIFTLWVRFLFEVGGCYLKRKKKGGRGKRKKEGKKKKGIFCILHPIVAWIRTASSSIQALLSMLYCGKGSFPRDVRTRQQFVTGSSILRD